jgi:hypothetical protein
MKYSIYITIALFLVGCSQSASKIDLNSHTQMFQRGYKDGCRTANGNYTKNHKLFNDNLEYHEGWFGGRKECNN